MTPAVGKAMSWFEEHILLGMLAGYGILLPPEWLWHFSTHNRHHSLLCSTLFFGLLGLVILSSLILTVKKIEDFDGGVLLFASWLFTATIGGFFTCVAMGLGSYLAAKIGLYVFGYLHV